MIEIDSFGNLITNITADMLAGRPTDRRACIVCNIYETWGIYHAYAEQAGGTLVALIGSGGRLELAIVGDNAARRLGIGVGRGTLAWEGERGGLGIGDGVGRMLARVGPRWPVGGLLDHRRRTYINSNGAYPCPSTLPSGIFSRLRFNSLVGHRGMLNRLDDKIHDCVGNGATHCGRVDWAEFDERNGEFAS